MTNTEPDINKIDDIIKKYLSSSGLDYNKELDMYSYTIDPFLDIEDIEHIVRSDTPQKTLTSIINSHVSFEYDTKIDSIIFALEHKYPNLSDNELFLECLNKYIYGNVKKSYLQQEINFNIMVDCGNKASGFKSDRYSPWYKVMPDDSSLLWLAKQQGYRKTELNAILKFGTNEYPDEHCLTSIFSEYMSSPQRSTLTFFVRLTIEQYLMIRAEIDNEAQANNNINAKRRMGRSFIMLDKSVQCGLTNPVSGETGNIGIILKKNIRFPIRYIYIISYNAIQPHPFSNDGSIIWKKVFKGITYRKTMGTNPEK